MQTFNVHFYILQNKSNKRGEAPIYARITVNGKRSLISIGRSIDPDKWDVKSGRSKGKKEADKELNSTIDSVLIKIHRCKQTLLDKDKEITAQTIKDEYQGLNEKHHSLKEVFEYHNNQMKGLIGKDFASATYKRFETTLMHIEEFLYFQYKKKDIRIKDLEYRFITELEHYFKTVRKCNHNTTIKYIRNLRKIINLAINLGWLEKDPFRKFKATIQEVKRDILNKEELQKIETHNFENERLEIVRDIFVFSCYTGLAYVDVSKLTPANITIGIDKGKWIVTSRTKTDVDVKIPILPKAMEVIEKYKTHPEVISKGTLLPIKSNQKLNAYLKEIAAICGINKNLTFHLARHTFATTVTLSNNVPIESVSKLLGHKNIKTTQIYAKVVDEKLGRDMDNLKNVLLQNNEEESTIISQ